MAAAYPGPRVRALLDRWQALYLLGSVLPDSGFYTLAGRHRAELLSLAEILHGTSQDDPLFFVDRAVTEPLTALALGVASHIMVDSQFHPIVYHFCGIDERHPGAIERHYAFEGWLDVHYRSLEAPPGGGLVAGILRETGMPLREVAALARSLLFDEAVSTRTVAAELRRHARIQRLFCSSTLRRIVAGARRLRPGTGGPYAALLYPAYRGPVPFFSAPFAYTHPSTGEERTEALADVEARAARLMHKVFDLFEGDARSRAGSASLPRLSAETGVAPAAVPRTRLMRYFRVSDVETLLGVGASRAAGHGAAGARRPGVNRR